MKNNLKPIAEIMETAITNLKKLLFYEKCAYCKKNIQKDEFKITIENDKHSFVIHNKCITKITRSEIKEIFNEINKNHEKQ